MPPKSLEKERIELLQGTLDMLILRTLLWGPTHGHGIAKAIEGASRDVLKIDHGSLYPALQRLLQEGWVTAAWKTSPNNRRARYYSLTAAGRRHLQAETSRWDRLAHAIANVLRPAESAEEL
jgi:PadR family transcriptional regulator